MFTYAKTNLNYLHTCIDIVGIRICTSLHDHAKGKILLNYYT